MPNEYDIEIIETNVIDGGIEIFARAWKNGVQLGFGKDGTIDVERFRIFNPPVLVPDVNGSISKTITDSVNGDSVATYREDPEEAILQSLTHTISEVGKEGTTIVAGSIGNTTDTFYPDANTETTSVDGTVYFDGYGSSNWSALTGASTGQGAYDSATSAPVYVGGYITPSFWLYRGFFLFDTSSIPDTDTIDSATFSVWPSSKAETQTTLTNKSIRLVSSSPASNTAIATTDFGSVGSTALATDKTTASISTGSYTSFSLNSTGLSNISKTGVSKFALRHTADINSEAPQQTNPDKYDGIWVYSADQTGTTNDPKLVVVHSAAASTFTPRVSFIM